MGVVNSLNRNERLFLYGLARHPGLTDREIGGEMGLSRSTTTSIRNRLERLGCFSYVRVPDFGRLGCELFNVHYSHLNPLADHDAWWKGFQETRYFNNMFFYAGSSHDDVIMTVTRNYTEEKRGLDEILRLNELSGTLYDEHPCNIFFPLSLSKIFLFLDFSDLIGDYYRLGREREEKIEFKVPSRKPLNLTSKEKEVLYYLVKYPEDRDEDIAEKAGCSRQTVNKTKTSFEKEGLLTTRIIPNLRSLGFELLTFTHTTYNPATPIETRAEGITRIVRDSSQFMIISTDTESVRLSAFRDYHELQKKYTSFIKHYMKKKYILHNPTIKVHSISDPRFKVYMNFHKPLKSMLELR
ncbi:MAG: hypothetical protein ABIH11_05965 [Candidatus Altiarchaeota archaeon]